MNSSVLVGKAVTESMVKQRLESSDYGGWGDWAVAGVCGVGGTEFGGVVVVSAGCTDGGVDAGVL